MTLISDYVSKVQGEVDDTSLGALATIQQQVVDTYNELIEECNQFLQGSVTEDDTTVLNQTAYPVTKDANIIHQVAYRPVGATNFRLLQQISLEDYKNTYINRLPSLPIVWFLDGDVINVAPKPSEEGTVRRVYTPNYENPAQSDTSIIPDRYTRTVIDGAIYRFKAWENNLVASQLYERQYLNGKRKMFIQLSTRSKALSPKLYGN